MPPVRRLTAILAADVAGYSRLMGADEEGTHERLKAHLGQLVNPKISQHRGRTVKNTGDGLLAEFASVVDAVRCAAEVQRGMIDREPQVPDERRIRFRIGVNLGDVIVEEHDIFGDGVNVAARLEALAEPGGICVSATVRDHLGDRLPYAFEDMGEQSVKNIARSVRVFALRPEAIADLPASGLPFSERPQRARTIAMVGAAIAVVILAIILWRVWPSPIVSPTLEAVGSSAAPISQSLVAPRLSIMVFPFLNLNDDPRQQYLADGITEDLTTDLSRIAHMLVISTATAFTYKHQPTSARQLGREVGVRYVLEGSVQRSGEQLRINAQLISAESDKHLWAERFDRDMADLLAVQSEITHRIADALSLKLIAVEAARPSEHPDALDYILRGRAATIKGSSTPDAYSKGIEMFEHALALDPRSIEAQTRLGMMLTGRVLSGMSNSREADVARARGLIEQALEVSPGYSLVHLARGDLLRAEGRCDDATAEYEMVVASNPNAAGAFFALGVCKLATGSIDEVIQFEEKAIRLSPRDPFVFNRYLMIGEAQLLQSHIDEAIVSLEKAQTYNPKASFPRAWLASAYALKGDVVRAAAELADAQRLSSDDRYLSLAKLKMLLRKTLSLPKMRALYEVTYFAGLRKAGLPEE
jgi:adenylate cyclase